VETLDINSNLEDVLRNFVEKGHGSAVVTRDNVKVGIVTTWDVLEAIAEGDDLSEVKKYGRLWRGILSQYPQRRVSGKLRLKWLLMWCEGY